MLRNATVVRRGYEALNTADLETLADLFDEHASWHTPGRSPLAGDAVGRRAVFAHFARLLSETAGTFRANLYRVLTDEDGRMLGIHHSLGERDGKRLDVFCCTVFEIEHGRILDGREHVYDLRAWDEFWS
jgi:uncharacterized protein